MIGQGEGPLEMLGTSTEEMLQYKLTAADEQLAEMRQVLEDIEWIDDSSYGLGCPLCGQAHNKGHDDDCAVAKALSAAPKRGRVLWRGEGKASFRDGELRAVVLPRPGMADKAPNFFHRTRDLLAKLGDLLVTVTVREAE